MKSLRYYLFAGALCCSPVFLRAMEIEKEKNVKESAPPFSLAGALCYVTVGASEKETDIEQPVAFCLDRATKHYVRFYPQVLYAKLEKFHRVGKEDPYALVRLKEMVSGVGNNKMWSHRLFMVGNDFRYMQIFRDTGVADKNGVISLITKTIANIAIEVEERSVIVVTPAWFETRRVTLQDTSVVASKIAPKVVSDADTDAEIGGVMYGDDSVKVIQDLPPSSSSDNKSGNK